MDDIELKGRILSQAEEMFLKFGFSKVTMEEIAANLGISKKTIYKFFQGKDQLLKEIIHGMKCEVEDYVYKIWSNEKMDFVEKLKLLMNFIGKQSSKLHGPLLHDLQKCNPEIWKEVQEVRKKHSFEKFSRLLEEGIDKGVFRSDINKQLMVLFYLNAVQGIINPEVLSQLPFSADQVFEGIIKIMLEGLLTEEGRTKYISFQPNDYN